MHQQGVGMAPQSRGGGGGELLCCRLASSSVRAVAASAATPTPGHGSRSLAAALRWESGTCLLQGRAASVKGGLSIGY